MNSDEEGSSHEPRAQQLLKETHKILDKEGAAGWSLAYEALSYKTIQNATFGKALEDIRSRMHTPSDCYRPAILSLCSKAVSNDSKATAPIGASLTLFARAIGIHDDIIDKSRVKDKHLTLVGKFGPDLALVVSDVLLFKGYALLKKALEVGMTPKMVSNILSIIERIWFEQSEAEAFEIQARGRTDITPQECLKKIGMRAAEMEACTRIGGILGGGSAVEVENLGKFGRILGTTAILRNELIDMLEFKVLRHRIRKESLPLPLVFSLQNKQFNSKLLSLISQKALSKHLLEISRLTDESGGMSYVATLIEEMVNDGYSTIAMFRRNEKAYNALKLLLDTKPLKPEEWKPLLYEAS